MAGFYSKHAGPKLKQLMEAAADGGKDRLSLDEEIDLTRTLALRAIQLYEVACLDETQSAKTSVDQKAAAIAGARNAMSHVADLVTKAAKIRALDANLAVAPAVDFVVQQVLKAIEEEIVPSDKELADRVIARIDEIRLPDTGGPTTIVID